MYLFLFAIFLPSAFGQSLSKDLCPIYGNQSIANFESSRYLGKWYEVKRFETFFEYGGTCVTATYTDEGDGQIGVLNAHYDPRLKMDKSIKGYAFQKYPENNDGQLLVKFPDSSLGDYWIVDTDYDNYSIVFSCYDLPSSSVQFLWLLSRTPQFTPEIQTNVDSILKQNKIDQGDVIKTVTDEKSCGNY